VECDTNHLLSTSRRLAGILSDVTTDDEREYVRRWVETGRVLERLRWQELRVLDEVSALCASDDLIESALLVPLPTHRQHWSGLVEQQALLHRRST
jgi:hypothetical protein